jgi:hypothetical protein
VVGLAVLACVATIAMRPMFSVNAFLPAFMSLALPHVLALGTDATRHCWNCRSISAAIVCVVGLAVLACVATIAMTPMFSVNAFLPAIISLALPHLLALH